MAENILIGKVIAFNDEETIASTDPKKEPFRKRKLFLDCTRYDQWTHQVIGQPSTPLLEFGGKSLEQLNELIRNGLKKDAVVSVKFQIVGRQVRKDGKMSVFNDVRPYAIELYRPEYYSNHQPTGHQPAPTAAPMTTAAPAPQQEPQPQVNPFPPADNAPACGTDDILPF